MITPSSSHNGMAYTDNNAGTNDYPEVLQKIREIDYLGPVSSTKKQEKRRQHTAANTTPSITSSANVPFQPVGNTVVMSREEMMKRLAEYKRTKKLDRQREDVILRDIVRQFVQQQQNSD